MGKQANSLERGLASMSFCPRCGLQLPEGSSFCYQCGAHLREGETITPQLEADATPPQFGLAGAGEISRFTPHAADEPICSFCKGPLDLSGEFCEMCGAPVSEPAPSRWLRRAPVASPVVSKESSSPKPSAASLAGPPTANATSPSAARSYVPSPSVPSRPEEKASRTPPINTSPHPRADPLRSLDRKPDKPAATVPPSSPAPVPAISAQAFRAKGLANEVPKKPVAPLPIAVAAPLPQTAVPREIAAPPGTTPVVSMPLHVPVRGGELFPAQPKRPFPLAAPAVARLAGPPPAKATSSTAMRSYVPSPSVPSRPEEKATRTPPLSTPLPPRADQPGSLDGKPGRAAPTLLASPPAPVPATSGFAFEPIDLAVEPPTVEADQLGKIVSALMHQNAAASEIERPLPEITPTVSVPLSVPDGREVVIPARPRKPFPFVLVGGVTGLLLAIGMVAGWHLFHRRAHSAGVENVMAQQVYKPAPSTETASPTLAPVDTSPPASELPEERPQAPAPARKSRRVKAITAAKPAVPATDHHAAELVSLQNLAREAYAKGNYAEPRDASAIAYSQQALALDPSNGFARTLLEDSIKGGKYQVQQAILSKDFTTAHRIADALAQLLPGESVVADLKTEIASAEKAQEESRRAKQVPVAVLSFRVYHMHSGKAPPDKGLYCRGMLSVVGGHLKYVGETGPDGPIHSIDIACSEVVEVKKNFRVASRENGFHVRTASSNNNFVPEDGLASHISALGSACSR